MKKLLISNSNIYSILAGLVIGLILLKIESNTDNIIYLYEAVIKLVNNQTIILENQQEIFKHIN